MEVCHFKDVLDCCRDVDFAELFERKVPELRRRVCVQESMVTRIDVSSQVEQPDVIEARVCKLVGRSFAFLRFWAVEDKSQRALQDTVDHQHWSPLCSVGK